MEIWSKYGDDIVAVISSAFEIIANIIKTTLNVIKDVIKIVTSIIKGDWQGVWEGIKNLTSDLWNGLKNIIKSALDFIKNTISLEMKFVQNLMSGIWQGIKSVTTSAWNGIKSAIVTPINLAKNTVKNAIDSIQNFFKNIKIPEIKIPKIKLPHFTIKGGFSISPPRVPTLDVSWYDKGGIFTRPSIIGVGERRPEFVGALEDLRYLIRDEFNRADSITGVINNNFHISEMTVKNETDIKKIANELYKLQQSRSRMVGVTI